MINKYCSTKKEKIYASIYSTLFWWIIAHGFAFTNLLLSHDSISEFAILDSAKWKIQLGRFFEPLLRLIVGEYVTIPWLTAIVSVTMLIIAVYLTYEIFELKSFFEMLFLSGVYVTNVSVTSTIASFSHDLAGDMVALALAVYAVYIWKELNNNFKKRNLVLAIICVSIILGFYQAYLSVTVVLVIIYSIVSLIRNHNAWEVFKNCLLAVLIIGIGFVLYLLLTKTVCTITGIKLIEDNYNSLSNLWSGDVFSIKKLAMAYAQVAWAFIMPTYTGIATEYIGVASYLKNFFYPTIYNAWLFARTFGNVVLIILNIVSFIVILIDNKIDNKNKIFILLLVIILPIGMNISYFASGVSHDLMHFSYWMFYLSSWLMVNNVLIHKTNKEKIYSLITAISISLFLISNVQASNLVYVKKELLKDSTLSTMTRILYRIEDLDEFNGLETPIAFIGSLSVQEGIEGTHIVSEISGVHANSQITYQLTYERYFKNILHYDIKVCNSEKIETLKNLQEVKEMPVFPAKGSVKLIDGVIVVKLSTIDLLSD